MKHMASSKVSHPLQEDEQQRRSSAELSSELRSHGQARCEPVRTLAPQSRLDVWADDGYGDDAWHELYDRFPRHHARVEIGPGAYTHCPADRQRARSTASPGGI